ncbi:MAG: hypothetical protein KJO01_01605 [Gammaproteobacteria bacterium]|nr:hypothetical protein [Gammaproteobacteria bacterium]MBT8110397.1 hypothetical protein [Gammaproteobacteria bacterium]NND46419.1 hypothetical protein [Woeseiaceae bacterium]NNL45098.1 hypothetical protein [Woeseiaceae bacterium]
MTMSNFSLGRYISCIGVLLFSAPVWADQVINDDLIVDGSQCVGADCADGELFDFDTIKLKSSDPQIRFQDTSTSAGFPTNDWLMGITDDTTTGSAYFYITDERSGLEVLHVQATDLGGVALGAGSAVVPDAISVGAPGAERPIVNVAPGTADTDAVNMQQFVDFQTGIDTSPDALAIEAEIAAVQIRIDELNNRVNDLLDRVNAL